MKSHALHLRPGVSVLLPGGVQADVNAAKAMQLAQKYNCLACHTVDKKLVGPAYKDVAKKYAGDKSAPEKLEHKVKSGGSGALETLNDDAKRREPTLS